jgi:hypothetical protein
MQLEDFRTRETMWNYMWYARRFMEENLPFWEMNPADELLGGEAVDVEYGGGEVFAKEGVVYAIYLPRASATGSLFVGDSDGDYNVYWYNPRSGEFVGEGVIITAADGMLVLGEAPSDPDEDWVVLVVNAFVGGVGTSEQ